VLDIFYWKGSLLIHFPCNNILKISFFSKYHTSILIINSLVLKLLHLFIFYQFEKKNLINISLMNIAQLVSIVYERVIFVWLHIQLDNLYYLFHLLVVYALLIKAFQVRPFFHQEYVFRSHILAYPEMVMIGFRFMMKSNQTHILCKKEKAKTFTW